MEETSQSSPVRVHFLPYQRPPPIKLYRQRRIVFSFSKPKIFFTLKAPKVTPHGTKTESMKSKGKKQTLVLHENTFLECFQLLQSLKKQTPIRDLFDLIGKPLDTTLGYSAFVQNPTDLSRIEQKLINCQYGSTEDFKNEICSFLRGFGEIYDDKRGRSAYRLATQIEDAFERLPHSATLHQFVHLEDTLKAFSSVEVIAGQSPLEIHFEDLAKQLNELDPVTKLRAERIVRIHCPNMAYYTTNVDLVTVPYPAIIELTNLVNKTHVNSSP